MARRYFHGPMQKGNLAGRACLSQWYGATAIELPAGMSPPGAICKAAITTPMGILAFVRTGDTHAEGLVFSDRIYGENCILDSSRERLSCAASVRDRFRASNPQLDACISGHSFLELPLLSSLQSRL